MGEKRHRRLGANISTGSKHHGLVIGGAVAKVAMVLTLVLLFCGGYSGTVLAHGDFASSGIKVMTQNLYIGADIFATLQGEVELLPLRVAQTFGKIRQANFPERAKALADIIARRRPDLIGLQEVWLIRQQSPSNFFSHLSPDAEEVVYDYLEILLDELAEQGLDYYVAAVIEDSDIELPMVTTPTGSDLADVRITDRDVILARSSVVTANERALNYPVEISLQLPFTLPDGRELTILSKRGFVAVEATVRGRTLCFVNTHLEINGDELMNPENEDDPNRFIPLIQAAQTQFLLGFLAGETLPCIVVGDFNSGPADAIRLIDGIPLVPPYKQFVFGDYSDVWLHNLLRFTNPDGFTCCQDEDLLNEVSALDQRFDLIFVRNKNDSMTFSIVGPVLAVVLGDEPRDKTISDMWPSDHAGVVARLYLPDLQEWDWGLSSLVRKAGRLRKAAARHH